MIDLENLLDDQGFLKDLKIWDIEIAEEIAKLEKIQLTSAHWEILDFSRAFYLRYQHIPIMRIFMKAMQQELSAAKASSLYLNTLFSENPLRKICRIAGLPKPRHCL